MASSLGMAIGPLLGGLIVDGFNTYDGLYIGSFVMGLSAAGIMLAFWPRRPEAIPA